MRAEGCDEMRLVAFLAGDLDPASAAEVDAHLLSCEPCWAALAEDRLGAEAARWLREPSPDAVRDSVRVALQRARPSHASAGRHRLALAGAALAAGSVVLAVALVTIPRGDRPDPGAVAAVVALARGDTATMGGDLHVWHTRAGSGIVVVAESSANFPVPPHTQTGRLGASDVWSARRSGIQLLCIMNPRHVLVAGAVPEAELAAVARAYGLLG